MLTVLVTGANRGLGLAFVDVYAQAGWRVFACCRQPDKATELLSIANRYPTMISLFELDVTKPAHITQLVKDLNLASIDVLINNAGIYGPTGVRFENVTEKPWLEVFHVNTIAPLMLSQALLTNIVTSQRRTIANISSLMGSIEANTEGKAYIYRSSKAALNAITKSMAIDLALQQVTAVAINPGWVQTHLGGHDAPLLPTDSVTAIKRVLDYLTPNDSGKFFDYLGQELPW